MFGFYKEKRLVPGQIYTAPVAVPAQRPTIPTPPTVSKRNAVAPAPLDKLLRALETLGIGALTAGLLAAGQAVITPDVFLHPHRATGIIISAGIGGMVLYVSKSSWVQKALAAGQAAGTDAGESPNS